MTYFFPVNPGVKTKFLLNDEYCIRKYHTAVSKSAGRVQRVKYLSAKSSNDSLFFLSLFISQEVIISRIKQYPSGSVIDSY